jgi:hypothetical protein
MFWTPRWWKWCMRLKHEQKSSLRWGLRSWVYHIFSYHRWMFYLNQMFGQRVWHHNCAWPLAFFRPHRSPLFWALILSIAQKVDGMVSPLFLKPVVCYVCHSRFHPEIVTLFNGLNSFNSLHLYLLGDSLHLTTAPESTVFKKNYIRILIKY